MFQHRRSTVCVKTWRSSVAPSMFVSELLKSGMGSQLAYRVRGADNGISRRSNF